MDLYYPVTYKNDAIEFDRDERLCETHCEWFEHLHRMLIGFRNLKCVLIRSWDSRFTRWLDSKTIKEILLQNHRLEDVTLYAECGYFQLDDLLKNEDMANNLKYLAVRQGKVLRGCSGLSIPEGGFTALRDMTIKCTPYEECFGFLSVLATPNVHLESLTMDLNIDSLGNTTEEMEGHITPSQRISLFGKIRTLCIDTDQDGFQLEWLKWFRPYCSNLQNITITVTLDTLSDILDSVPAITRCLGLVINNFFMQYHWVTWQERLLSVLHSVRFAALKRLCLKAKQPLGRNPGSMNNECATGQSGPNDEERLIEIFGKTLKATCNDAGIEFSLDYSVCYGNGRKIKECHM